jgi:GntR family transcriptional regulator
MLTMEINNKSPVPIYSQIVEQFKHMTASGKLKTGERVPTIRELAVQLEINPNTVAKAYLELQNIDLLETKQGIGTFVKEALKVTRPDQREEKLNSLIRSQLVDVLRLGYSKDEILKTIKKELSSF